MERENPTVGEREKDERSQGIEPYRERDDAGSVRDCPPVAGEGFSHIASDLDKCPIPPLQERPAGEETADEGQAPRGPRE